ncbi:hypothetical protein BDR07DRAFT_1459881 [Suillus spraguei]|nr:hypothetical protein BDR07DRAFT_1459881 [Suillus spraguei]
MLTLSPGSVCDVCAEEYNSRCVPHSIPCGHIFCWNCCHKIVRKTLPRLQAACPFCSNHFISDDVRLIHINFLESGRITPPGRRGGPSEVLDRSPSRKEDWFPLVEPSFSHIRVETRRLEDKVAKVAARKCSVEEVSTLYKELEEWLTHDENFQVQSYSLSSSAALLKTILMNHIAHSEAAKMAKAKLDDMELKVSRLEIDLKQYRTLYTQKIKECQALRAELTRCTLKSSSRAANLPARPNTATSTRLSEHRQSVSSSVASLYKVPAMSSILPHFASAHSRSASSVVGVQKPATPARMASPSMISEVPMMMSSRLHSIFPIPPSKSSTTSPQTNNTPRSDNQERAHEVIHKRWLPAPNVAHPSPTSKAVNYSPYLASSPGHSRTRTSFSTKATTTLPQIIITPTQPDNDVWGLDKEWELDKDGSELDEGGSELDEDGSELDEDGSEPDEDEDEWEQEPTYERWIPPPNTMANAPTGKPVNYPTSASFPPPGRARTSFSTNAATRLPQTITPVQQDGSRWERRQIHERWMPSPNALSVPTDKNVNHSSYFGSSPAPGLVHTPFSTCAAAALPQTITPVHPDKPERGRKRIHERWMPSPNILSNPPRGKTVNCPTYFGSFSAPGRTGF